MTAPIRQIGRRKNLPGVGFTVGEFRGVTSLARVKGRYVPASTAALRKRPKKSNAADNLRTRRERRVSP
jgi:hypothetical protein